MTSYILSIKMSNTIDQYVLLTGKYVYSRAEEVVSRCVTIGLGLEASVV